MDASTATTQKDFLSQYLSYTANTESPRIYHRWCGITAIGALLGRSLYIQHGHFRIYPNIYCMLIGNPAARKSTAIKLSRKLLTSAGYTTFAADKSSKEKFLVDLANGNEEGILEGLGSAYSSKKLNAETELNLWGSESGGEFQDPKEVFIAADEFNEFVGTANSEFFTTLGNFWDWDSTEPFKQRFKSGSVSIWQPTVSLLGGNTQEGFARAFPPDVVGRGFLSRLILIFGQRTNKRIAFPVPPSEEITKLIVDYFTLIRRFFHQEKPTEVHLGPAVIEMLTTIYEDPVEINDLRFDGYNQRRFTQLLKLCIILAGASLRSEVTIDIVVYANTILSAAENNMPTALGEFGKSKNSDVANNIVRLLETSNEAIKYEELWKLTQKDLERSEMLGQIIQGLLNAQRIQYINGLGYLPKKEPRKTPQFVDWSLLSDEERSE